MAERLDRDFQRASVNVAKACTRNPNGANVRQLAVFRQRKIILLRVLSQYKLQRSFQAALSRLCPSTLMFTAPDTVEECQTLCRQYQKEIRLMECDAVHLRQIEQQQQYRLAVAERDMATAKAIKHRLAAEHTKAMYAKIRHARGRLSGGLMHLEVPRDPETRNYQQFKDWITLDTPSEIEARLLAS